MPLTPSMENYLKAVFTLRQAYERVRCSDCLLYTSDAADE